MSGISRHFRIAKEKVIRDIVKHGPRYWDENFEGTTTEAIKSVIDRPGNEYTPLGDCDNFVDDNCAGHPST